jgi:hypothetical protein
MLRLIFGFDSDQKDVMEISQKINPSNRTGPSTNRTLGPPKLLRMLIFQGLIFIGLRVPDSDS